MGGGGAWGVPPLTAPAVPAGGTALSRGGRSAVRPSVRPSAAPRDPPAMAESLAEAPGDARGGGGANRELLQRLRELEVRGGGGGVTELCAPPMYDPPTYDPLPVTPPKV